MEMEAKKRRATTVVTIEWILFLIVSIYLFGAVGHYYNSYSKTQYKPPNRNSDPFNEEKIFVIALTVAVFLNLLLNILLTFAVYKENKTFCKIWYILGITGIVLHILDFLRIFLGLNVVSISLHALMLFYKIYSVKTIMNFAEEIALSRERAAHAYVHRVMYKITPAAAGDADNKNINYPSITNETATADYSSPR